MDVESKTPQIRYVIVTPARDEAGCIENTIAGVLGQAIRPVEWLIVDDGSRDATGEIVAKHSSMHPWISCVRGADRGRRDSALGGISAFLQGYRALKSTDWDFLVNLDADLALEPQYFEICFEEFRRDPTLGIGGGTLYHRTAAGQRVVEVSRRFHVRGGTKIYRRACWDAIGGLKEVLGWDTVDEAEAGMAGWQVRSFAHVMALHQRPTGGAEGGWRDGVKNGRVAYFLGYHPLFMLVKFLRWIPEKPFLVRAVGHLYGFMGGYLEGRPQFENKAVVTYLRRQQARRIFPTGASKRWS